jgi:hypothetical protein
VLFQKKKAKTEASQKPPKKQKPKTCEKITNPIFMIKKAKAFLIKSNSGYCYKLNPYNLA